MYSVYAETLQLEKTIAAENGVGIILRGASASIQDNQIKFSNNIVSAFARPDCPKYYSASLNPQCSYVYGVKMGIVSLTVFPPITRKPSNQYDSLCKIERVDLRVYINNVEFSNFKLTHDTAPRCGKNAVFKTHIHAHEMTGQHYLVNSPCQNCEFDAILFQMREPDWSRLGSFGGCGSFECTGQKNVLIEDQTGDFFGQIGQAISNNTYFGPNVTHCIRKDTWNGYWCPEHQITTLMFMSTAPDYNTRLYSPIKLTNGFFFNQPLNLRESKIINMTNAGINPTSSEYWLSKRSEVGSPEDYVILKWQFQVSQIIQVSVNNKVILQRLTTKSKHYDLMTRTNICGANNYFHENQTIHFVITGQLGCKVKISLKVTVLYSQKFQVSVSNSFSIYYLFGKVKYKNCKKVSQILTYYSSIPLNFLRDCLISIKSSHSATENHDMMLNQQMNLIGLLFRQQVSNLFEFESRTKKRAIMKYFRRDHNIIQIDFSIHYCFLILNSQQILQ